MARKRSKRATKYKVAIVGEGLTEWYYFTNMKQSERFGFTVKPDLPKHSDYKTIIDVARKKKEQGYDLVFCVLDLDRILTNETESKGYRKEKEKKKLNIGIEFIESMPCIELWFLLYFLPKYSTRIYTDFNQVNTLLKKHIPNYEKTEKFLKSLNLYEYLNKNGNLTKADSFATQLCKEAPENGNPLFNFTEINRIITELKNKCAYQ